MINLLLAVLVLRFTNFRNAQIAINEKQANATYLLNITLSNNAEIVTAFYS